LGFGVAASMRALQRLVLFRGTRRVMQPVWRALQENSPALTRYYGKKQFFFAFAYKKSYSNGKNSV
jgi:hypothetical protein